MENETSSKQSVVLFMTTFSRRKPSSVVNYLHWYVTGMANIKEKAFDRIIVNVVQGGPRS